MCKSFAWIWLIVAISLCGIHSASAQVPGRGLQIVNPSLPLPDAGSRYQVRLRAMGGLLPYHWSFAATGIPPWLGLDATSGVLSGRAPSNDGFAIWVQVTDSANPPNMSAKLLVASTDDLNPTQPRAFQMVTPNLPSPVAGERYVAPLKAVGGRPPYRWTVAAASLPPGLSLDESRGVIYGTPQSSDEFSVLIQVADASEPPLALTKLLFASSAAPLTVRWTVRPHVNATNISGAVRVKNSSKDTVSTSVIVVAVNEYGKAFSLRYEQMLLGPGDETPDLSFDVFMPLGQYTAHVDAVGEVPAKNAIYRDRRELQGLIVQDQ